MTLTYSVDWAAKQARNPKTRFLFFWGHKTRKDGVITETCLSQWYPARFRVDRQTYLTAEHWMMAEKARLFGDRSTLAKILDADNPGKAKALGREVVGYDGALWDAEKTRVVTEGNLHKFRGNPDMAAFLAKTGRKILVEASPVDPIWGIGMGKDDSNATQPEKWKGENLLGFCLMQVRDELENVA